MTYRQDFQELTLKKIELDDKNTLIRPSSLARGHVESDDRYNLYA